MSKKKKRGRISEEELAAALGGLDDELLEPLRALDVDRIIEKAREALAEYDYEGAHELFKAAAWLASGEEAAVVALATFLVDDYAHFDEAVTLLRCEACDVDTKGRRLLARALFMSGRSDEALDVYTEINAEGGDALSWKRQGKLLKDKGLRVQAVAAFARVLELEPADSEARMLKDECQTEAAGEFESVLEAVRSCIDAGDVEGARRKLESIGGMPWYPQQYYHLLKRMEEASAITKAAQLAEQAFVLVGKDDLAGALSVLRRVLELDPANAPALAGIRDVQDRLSKQDIAQWMGLGNQRFSEGRIEDALLYYLRALDRDIATGTSLETAGPLLELGRSMYRALGRMPSASQVQALENLFRARTAMDDGDTGRAETYLSLAPGVVDLLEEGRGLQDAIQGAKDRAVIRQAEQWLKEASSLEESGRIAAAVKLLQRASQVPGFDKALEAGRKGEELEQALLASQRESAARKYVDTLIEQSSFFAALTEVDKLRLQQVAVKDLDELEEAARRGVAQKYSMDVTRLDDESPVRRGEWNSEAVGMADFGEESTRVVTTGPRGENVFVLDNERMLSFSSRHMASGFAARLPEQAVFAPDQGSWLHDFSADGSDVLLAVNFEEKLVLYFVHRRARLELDNVISLEKIVQQTRQKTTRWFAVYGRELQLLICQSSPGADSKGRIYAVSLQDGKLLYDETFGYAVNSLRRFPGTDNQFIVHRYPEGVQMRRPGFFSFATMDNRMRFDRRFLIRPEEMDSTLVESTRWVRRCDRSGRMYFLFRYYDMYSGQLVPRPLAFAALDTGGQLLYAAADSSSLVRNGGDLLPVGELIPTASGEHLVMLGRKGEDQKIFVVETEGFKLKSQVEVSPAEKALSISRGVQDGRFVVLSVRRKDGVIVAREHEIGS